MFGSQLRISVLMLVIFTVLTGIIYPGAITGIAQKMFPSQANGSLILADGKAIGSKLIGQEFSDPKYLWGRPSATLPGPFNAASSSGANIGPSNPALLDNVKKRMEALKAADPDNTVSVPVDLVTSSGSGLDPHISPAAAYYQAKRIAAARGIPLNAVNGVIKRNTESRFLWLFGEPAVNVLKVNLELDSNKK